MKELKLKQSNALILATHEMNIQQMRLFFFACSQYNGDLNIEVLTEDLYRILAPQGGKQQDLLRKAIPTMMRDAIVHINDEEKEGWACVFTDSYIVKNKPIVRFKFNSTIKNELEAVKNYTRLHLMQLTGLSSVYAVRLYEFCAMRLGSRNTEGEFNFKIDKLREYLDCVKKYDKFKDFEKYVLLKAQQQINEKTNIIIEHTKIKKGRTITNIVFTFKWKNKEDAINVYKEDYIEPSQEPGEEAQVEPSTIEEDETMEEGKAVIDQLLKEIRESKEKVNHNKVIKR